MHESLPPAAACACVPTEERLVEQDLGAPPPLGLAKRDEAGVGNPKRTTRADQGVGLALPPYPERLPVHLPYVPRRYHLLSTTLLLDPRGSSTDHRI